MLRGWAGLLVLLLCCPLLASAQADAITIGNHDSYVLSRAFTYLEDSSAALTLDEVLQADSQARFKPVSGGNSSTNFGTTNSAIWLRAQLHPGDGTPRHWLLEIAYPPLDRLDLYQSNSSGGYDHQSGGDSLPFSARAVPHHNHMLTVDLEPGRESTLYLRITSQGVVSAPATLWQPAALWQHDQKNYSIFSLYFGLLTGLVLYNLLLFFSVRDPAFLIYVAFAASIGLAQAANSGLGTQFLWPEALWWNNNSINIAHSASGAFGLLFARSFLATRSKLPRLDRLMQIQIGLWIATIFAAVFLPYKVAGSMSIVLILLGVATVILAGGVSIRRRHPGAPYFGLAWSAFLLGVMTQAMHNYGLLPSNLFTANGLLIGSSMEMVLLSFALANRINVARQEKELAQAQVTAEQAVVRALQQSQERYLSVIEHVGEGMVVVQNDHFVFANARAAEILEASKADIMAHGVINRVHADDRQRLTERVRLRLAGQDVSERCQVRLEFGEGQMKWLEFGDHLVPWDGGQGLLIFFLDVTQRHTAELESRAALDRQQELNDLRSRFVAMTSHEFRTPLTAIMSAQDLLKNFNDRLPASQKLEIFDLIESSVRRMTHMLERVLLLGQADVNMLEFKPQQLDVKTLCQDLVAEARNQQPDSPCHVAVEFSANLVDGLYDEKLLRHIFSNLLSNAIKYSPLGGEVHLKVFAQGPHTVFEVSDQGIGIPPDELGHLFESFHRASNVGAISGTGLGLAIVKQSVDLHGGRIDVHSLPGQGTTFTVTL